MSPTPRPAPSRRPARVPLVVLLAPLLVACSGLTRVDACALVTSGRDGWQHPDRVIESLAIRPGDRVAEVGAGEGYWLEALSAAVGPTGRVYAVEVEPALVEALRARVAEAGLGNVEVVLGAFDDPNLPDGGIDLLMTCLTYHHIEARVDYFRRVAVDLAPGGRIAHLDDRPDAGAPIAWFQTDGHWIDPDLVVSEMAAAGYVRVAAHDFLPAQSFQVFAPARAAAADPASTATR